MQGKLLCCLGLDLDPEQGGSTFLRNIDTFHKKTFFIVTVERTSNPMFISWKGSNVQGK
jgi:hypothetical protein